MNIQNKKILVITVVMLLMIIVVPFSLAYFFITNGAAGTLNLDLETVDNRSLIFNRGQAISLQVTMAEFYQGGTDKVLSTTPSVTFMSKDSETEKYNIYLYLYDNRVIYTTENETPELILNVYDENDEEMKVIEGLDYIDEDTISGFDITSVNGILPISLDKEITVDNSTEVHNWTFKVTLRNLDELQNLNLGQGLNSQICLAQSLDKCDFVGLGDVILAQNGGASYIESKIDPDFTKAAITQEAYDTYDEWCTNTTYCSIDRATPNENGIYATEDQDGTTYYYRGAVDNNWVVFGKEGEKDIYWRIVRVEGNGNVKMIYSGTTPPTEADAITMESSSVQLAATTAFNTSYNSTVYVGYVYQTGVLHGTSTSSTIKGKIDAWYNTNLASDYGEYIAPSDYCIDRVAYTKSGGSTWAVDVTFTKNSSQTITTTSHHYQSVKRLADGMDSNPSLFCETSTDSLNLNVGLISADESAYAGGRISTYNQSYYLYANDEYWLISPFCFHNSSSILFSINTGGNIYYTTVGSTLGMRPTISLSSDVLALSGKGTWNDPYIIA